MKKIISLILALALICSLSLVAFAGGVTSPADAVTYTITKEYTTTAGKTPATVPNETLTFKVEPKDGNPTKDTLTVEDVVVDNSTEDITIKTPEYNTPGEYFYTISEVEGNTQGVTYTDTVITVHVLVSFNEDHTKLETEAQFALNAGDLNKIEKITNLYDLGGFSVKKELKGNLADPTDEFKINVKLTAEGAICSDITYAGKENGTIKAAEWKDGSWNKTFVLSGDDTINFTNVPAGVTWSVVEEDYTTGAVNDKNYGYEEAVYDENCKGTVVADKTVETVIINGKGTEVETGIALDSIPYIVMLIVAAAAAVLFLRKKSYEA